MAWSLALAIVLTIGIAALWWPIRDARPKHLSVWLSGLAWLGLASWVTVEIFFDPHVYGVPTTGAIDPVSHTIELVALLDDPKFYWGMTAFHGTAHWLERLGLDTFRAFRLVLYGMLVGAIVYVALVQAALSEALRRFHPHPVLMWGLPVLSLAIGSYAAGQFVFPLIHGYQLDGYYPQLHGLLPLFVAALLYGVCHHRLSRLLAMGLSLVLLRFSYLLNLSDLVVTCSVMVAVEGLAWEGERRRRAALLALAVVGALVGAYLYGAMLGEIAWRGGGIPAPNMGFRVLGTVLLSMLLLIVPGRVDPCLRRGASVARRLCTFVGVYGLIAALVQCTWLVVAELESHTGEELYYLHKYGFSACILVTLTAIPYLAYAIVAMVPVPTGWRLIRRLGGIVAAAIVALGGIQSLSRSLPEHYAKTFAERLRDEPSSMTALADRTAWRVIERVLGERKKTFGGFLAPLNVETHFAAYAFRGFADGSLELDETAGLPLQFDFRRVNMAQPGSCLFWLEPALFADAQGQSSVEARRRRTVEALHRGPKTCEQYWRRSFPSRRVELCHRCD